MDISADMLNLVLYGRLKRNIEGFLSGSKVYRRTIVPREVCILPSTIPGADVGVFSTTIIKQGTEMGPYTGRLFSKCEDSRCKISTHSWEILNSDGVVVGYVDGGAQPISNWLTHVQCARTNREQNLEVVQIGNQIYYRATKDIQRGDELLVWYGQTYTMYMGVPYTISQHTATPSIDIEKEDCSKDQDSATENIKGGKWKCVLCQRGFNSRSNLRSHMRIHTQEKPFSCKFCGRRFSQSSTLRNHVRLHTGEKPYKCTGCQSSYSQLAGLRAHQRSSTHKPNTVLERDITYTAHASTSNKRHCNSVVKVTET